MIKTDYFEAGINSFEVSFFSSGIGGEAVFVLEFGNRFGDEWVHAESFL